MFNAWRSTAWIVDITWQAKLKAKLSVLVVFLLVKSLPYGMLPWKRFIWIFHLYSRQKQNKHVRCLSILLQNKHQCLMRLICKDRERLPSKRKRQNWMRLIRKDLKNFNEMENNDYLLYEFYFDDKVVKIWCHTIIYYCNFSSPLLPWSLISKKLSNVFGGGLTSHFQNALL